MISGFDFGFEKKLWVWFRFEGKKLLLRISFWLCLFFASDLCVWICFFGFGFLWVLWLCDSCEKWFCHGFVWCTVACLILAWGKKLVLSLFFWWSHWYWCSSVFMLFCKESDWERKLSGLILQLIFWFVLTEIEGYESCTACAMLDLTVLLLDTWSGQKQTKKNKNKANNKLNKWTWGRRPPSKKIVTN
jgi:hypothetical protein